MRLDLVHFTQPLETGDYARLLQWVSLERRGRIDRYRFWKDAHRTLYAEILARLAVHLTLARPIESIHFETTDKGKPFLSGEPNFHFNISHSGDWVLCASAKAPVGVDVEQIQPLTPELLYEVLTPEERASYFSRPELDRLSYFYTLWTIKECYVKALGFGLQLHFQNLTVRMETPDDILVLRNGEEDPNARVQTFSLDSEHRAAICVLQGGSAPVIPATAIWWDEQQILSGLDLFNRESGCSPELKLKTHTFPRLGFLPAEDD